MVATEINPVPGMDRTILRSSSKSLTFADISASRSFIFSLMASITSRFVFIRNTIFGPMLFLMASLSLSAFLLTLFDGIPEMI
jgi:hypothetical protein